MTPLVPIKEIMDGKYSVPVLAFAGYSGSGKTTLMERVIRLLTGEGYHIAAVKHDVHEIQIDHEGKDSRRFQEAGASTVVLSSPGRTFTIDQEEKDIFSILSDLSAKAPPYDAILIEGWKHENLPKIHAERFEDIDAAAKEIAEGIKECICLTGKSYGQRPAKKNGKA